MLRDCWESQAARPGVARAMKGLALAVGGGLGAVCIGGERLGGSFEESGSVFSVHAADEVEGDFFGAGGFAGAGDGAGAEAFFVHLSGHV